MPEAIAETPLTHPLDEWDDGFIRKYAHQYEDGAPVPTRNNSGQFLSPPRFLVLHYTATATHTTLDVADYFYDRARTSVSAHFVIGMSGNGDVEMRQCLPVNMIGHHAGRSRWRGINGLNRHSIGIEICNWGWLNKSADGTFTSWAGTIIPADSVVEAEHWHDGWPRYWHKYPPRLLDGVEQLCRAIVAQVPSIREIVTHEMISPGRKADTGPAFPRQRFLNLVEDRATDAMDEVSVVEVTARRLNVRGGPSVEFDKMDWGPLDKGQRVNVEGEQRGWYLVNKNGAMGWVHGDYVKPAD